MTSLPAVTIFFVATAGHFVLVAAWLRLWQPALRRDADELAFQAIVIGAGSLLSVLQVLVFSVGLSFARGLIALAVAHAATAGITFWRGRGGRPQADQARPGRADLAGMLRQQVVPLAGLTIVAALIVDWTIAAASSLEVVGADAEHYHVPNAVNLALGAWGFGLPATPHPYPLGTSVLAAWFMLPLRDLLLVDLAIVVPFLLAWVAMVRLVRDMTGQSGLAWAPWMALLFFSTPIAQQSLFMSADLFYAAAFLAVNALLLRVAARLEANRLELTAIALCLGMLIASKVTGAFSAVVLLAVYGAATGIRCLLARRQLSLPGAPIRIAALALLLFVASGGIWLIRNWWLFGSPIAPSGLSILGLQVFPGSTYESGKYYVSVLRDVRETSGYDLAARFAYWVNRWLGAWFLPAGLATIVLVPDVVAGLWKGRRLDDARRAKVIFAGATAIVLFVHLWVLAGVPWSSLESYHGFSLRYALPCFALYLTLACVAILTESVDWWRRRPVATSATLLLLATVWYVAHQPAPTRPTDVIFGLLTLRGTGISLLIVGGVLAVWRVRSRGLHAVLTAGLISVAALAAAYHIVRMDDTLVASAETDLERHMKDGGTDLRGVYVALLGHERATGTTCGRRRIFLTTRFDAPLELESPRFENEVFETRSTYNRSLVRRSLPGSRPCDYIVASRAELGSTRGVLLINQLKTRARILEVGSFDEHVVFEVRDRETAK